MLTGIVTDGVLSMSGSKNGMALLLTKPEVNVVTLYTNVKFVGLAKAWFATFSIIIIRHH
jgi:hypothetical protein